MKKTIETDNPLSCPVVSTLNLISGKWKPMVIHILIEQPMRFGEIRKLMSPISQKVLTQQLRELESTNIVNRQIIDGKVLNVTYSLSVFGKSLIPVLDAMHAWGKQHVVVD